MSSVTTAAPRTLGDVIPGGLVRNIALVVGGAVLVGLSAQVAIPLPFTPVPLTLQTFAVLLTGAVLGSLRGLLSMLLYTLVGVAGFGWFAGHHSGWQFASFGYILGFIIAATLVGRLAEGGADRTVGRTILMMVLGNVVIYAAGVTWLMAFTHMSLPVALAKGVVPFLIGDAIKIAVAAAVLPATWRLVNSRR
jgi:biotin transport system substrate-specific component